MKQKPTTEQIKRFISNLDKDSLGFIIIQILEHKESIEFIEKAIIEFNSFYTFPIKKEV